MEIFMLNVKCFFFGCGNSYNWNLSTHTYMPELPVERDLDFQMMSDTQSVNNQFHLL